MNTRLFHKPWLRELYLPFEAITRLIPDELYLKLIYRIRMGKKLNLKEPQTFNEKLQWLKLYDRKPLYTTMVDKYEAKKYVASIIGEEYIIPTLGVWNRFDEIDFDKLPEQFVLKCTHDSGGLVIVRDKKILDKEVAKKKIEGSLKRNFYWKGREWPYKNVKPQIIAEKYIDVRSGNLRDYKFFCFHNDILFMYVSEGMDNHKSAHMSFFSLEGEQLPFKRLDYKSFDGALNLPSGFQNMKEAAEKLSNAINSPFVRIDMYCIQDAVYFSEITFTPCGGFIPLAPESWDLKLGELISLSSTNVNEIHID